jgi:histidinol dehydrogenase
MLTRLDLRGVTGDLAAVLPRPPAVGEGPVAAVRSILAEVREGGDAAVRACTERFDKVTVDDLEVPASELAAALDRIPAVLRAALEAAATSIEAYQRATVPPEVVHEKDGILVRDLRRPVDRAGCYVPGGRATYPSTVLMTAIPAKVAGVGEVVLCVPPGPEGRVPDEVLAAAAIAGVDRLFTIGGAQAVAAMAYGTESVPAVDVIVGPGNVYVAVAKREVAGAGIVGVPSSVVVADGSSPVAYAAIDVVVQAEHGPDGLAWLLTWDEAVADAVTEEVTRIVEASPRRSDIESTLLEGGRAVVCDGPEQAMAVANLIAPEHLELQVADPEALLPLVRHAGAVFTGPHAPASVGDYLAGPSHVLPTNGSARFSSALRVDDFVKHVHVVSLDGPTLARVGEHVAAIAEAEGLDAHARSVRLRGS